MDSVKLAGVSKLAVVLLAQMYLANGESSVALEAVISAISLQPAATRNTLNGNSGMTIAPSGLFDTPPETISVLTNPSSFFEVNPRTLASYPVSLNRTIEIGVIDSTIHGTVTHVVTGHSDPNPNRLSFSLVLTTEQIPTVIFYSNIISSEFTQSLEIPPSTQLPSAVIHQPTIPTVIPSHSATDTVQPSFSSAQHTGGMSTFTTSLDSNAYNTVSLVPTSPIGFSVQTEAVSILPALTTLSPTLYYTASSSIMAPPTNVPLETDRNHLRIRISDLEGQVSSLTTAVVILAVILVLGITALVAFKLIKYKRDQRPDTRAVQEMEKVRKVPASTNYFRPQSTYLEMERCNSSRPVAAGDKNMNTFNSLRTGGNETELLSEHHESAQNNATLTSATTDVNDAPSGDDYNENKTDGNDIANVDDDIQLRAEGPSSIKAEVCSQITSTSANDARFDEIDLKD